MTVYRTVTIPQEAPNCWSCKQPIMTHEEQFISTKHPFDGPVHAGCARNYPVQCKKCGKQVNYTEANTAYWDYPNYYCDDCIESTYPTEETRSINEAKRKQREEEIAAEKQARKERKEREYAEWREAGCPSDESLDDMLLESLCKVAYFGYSDYSRDIKILIGAYMRLKEAK